MELFYFFFEKLDPLKLLSVVIYASSNFALMLFVGKCQNVWRVLSQAAKLSYLQIELFLKQKKKRKGVDSPFMDVFSSTQ